METRILLVEDNEDFSEAFARMLQLALAPELNVSFAQADSLAEAHTLLEQEEDGLDLVHVLNGHGERITSLPMLVRTANLDHSVAARAIEAGARGVLSKVVSTRETAGAVQRLIGAGRSAG